LVGRRSWNSLAADHVAGVDHEQRAQPPPAAPNTREYGSPEICNDRVIQRISVPYLGLQSTPPAHRRTIRIGRQRHDLDATIAEIRSTISRAK
jgi:hypothetical protein